jgi:hypothetical protein
MTTPWLTNWLRDHPLFRFDGKEWWYEPPQGRRYRCAWRTCPNCNHRFPARPNVGDGYCSKACGYTKRKLLTPEGEASLVKRYQDDKISANQLAEEHGTNAGVICAILRRQGCPVRSRAEGVRLAAQQRYDDHIWFHQRNGGRTKAATGYVFVNIRRDDPMASMAHFRNKGDRIGQILEHRLVMARKVGQPLHPDETVHHKNGIKDDNRLENLDLRAGPHGKGASVEDLESYAKRILELGEARRRA